MMGIQYSTKNKTKKHPRKISCENLCYYKSKVIVSRGKKILHNFQRVIHNNLIAKCHVLKFLDFNFNKTFS